VVYGPPPPTTAQARQQLLNTIPNIGQVANNPGVFYLQVPPEQVPQLQQVPYNGYQQPPPQQ
jgi:hypothetical protein